MKKIALVFVASLALLMAGLAFAFDGSEGQNLSGKVVEVMDSGGYTYVSIEKDKKNTWVAVPKMKVEKGKNVTFMPGMAMYNFKSKTMDRTFDVIYFSEGFAPAK